MATLEFSFTLEAAPPATSVIYKFPDTNYYLDVTYEKALDPDTYYINHITIHRDLAPGEKGPNYSLMGRSAPTTASLQMNIEKFCMRPCKKQTLKLGGTATFTITNLHTDKDFTTYLRCDSFSLTSNGLTRTYTPTKYYNNSVETLVSMGGARKTRGRKNKNRKRSRKV